MTQRPLASSPCRAVVAAALLGFFGCADHALASLTQDVAATPPPSVLDPSTFALIGLGLIGLAIFRRRSHESDER
jgi:hypothetical protein